MRIVVLVADSVRADAPGFMGGPCQTPTLDRMAAQGVVFETAWSAAPWTVPSVASIITGVYPHRLGVFRWQHAIPSQFETLFTLAARSGYRVASVVFNPRFLFVSTPEAGVIGSSQNLDAVVDWIDACPDSNLLVFIHYWGTHFPYLDKPMSVRSWHDMSHEVLAALRRHPNTVRPKLIAMYHRSVERMSERFLPRVLSAAARNAGADGCLAVLTADHGEGWGERMPGAGPPHDVFDLHGCHLYDEALRVPLVLLGPNWLSPRVVAGLARTVDLAPTLLELAALPNRFACPKDQGIDGRSLVGAMVGDAPEFAPWTLACASHDYLTTTHPAPRDASELWSRFALRSTRWKLHWRPSSGERLVFDLDQDAREMDAHSPGELSEPSQGWEILRREVERAQCAWEDPVDERLRGLGYIE